MVRNKSKKSEPTGKATTSTSRNAEASGSGTARGAGNGPELTDELSKERNSRKKQGDAAEEHVYGEGVSSDEEGMPTFNMSGDYAVPSGYRPAPGSDDEEEKVKDPTVPIWEAGRSVFEAKEPFSEEIATSTLKILEGAVEIVPTVLVAFVAAFVGVRVLKYGLPYVFGGLRWSFRSILVALEWTLMKVLWLADWLVYIAAILAAVALVVLGFAIAFYHLTIPEKRHSLFLRFSSLSYSHTAPALLLDGSLCIASLSLFYFLPFPFAIVLGLIWPTVCVGALCGYEMLVWIDGLARGWLAMRGAKK